MQLRTERLIESSVKAKGGDPTPGTISLTEVQAKLNLFSLDEGFKCEWASGSSQGDIPAAFPQKLRGQAEGICLNCQWILKNGESESGGVGKSIGKAKGVSDQ